MTLVIFPPIINSVSLTIEIFEDIIDGGSFPLLFIFIKLAEKQNLAGYPQTADNTRILKKHCRQGCDRDSQEYCFSACFDRVLVK